MNESKKRFLRCLQAGIMDKDFTESIIEDIINGSIMSRGTRETTCCEELGDRIVLAYGYYILGKSNHEVEENFDKANNKDGNIPEHVQCVDYTEGMEGE